MTSGVEVTEVHSTKTSKIICKHCDRELEIPSNHIKLVEVVCKCGASNNPREAAARWFKRNEILFKRKIKRDVDNIIDKANMEARARMLAELREAEESGE